MGEMGGAVSYLYWAQRRIERYMNDNGIKIRPFKLGASLSLPGVPRIVDFEKEVKRDQRPEISKKIEATLGASAVTAFDGPAPIRYAKATGGVIFGELAAAADEEEPKPAVIFTSCDYADNDRDSVAVCLFGSMENFEGSIQAAGPVQASGGGWRASSAPYMLHLLRTRGDILSGSPEELAVEALKIAGQQGFDAYENRPFGFDRPWLREFTYGDLQNAAEWLAEIYLDVDLLDTDPTRLEPARRWGFRRVLVGAPFWIRTPKPEAMRLYAKKRPTGSCGDDT